MSPELSTARAGPVPAEFTPGEDSRSGGVEVIHPRRHGVEVKGQTNRAWQRCFLGHQPST
jgi:hypothetical protein